MTEGLSPQTLQAIAGRSKLLAKGAVLPFLTASLGGTHPTLRKELREAGVEDFGGSEHEAPLPYDAVTNQRYKGENLLRLCVQTNAENDPRWVERNAIKVLQEAQPHLKMKHSPQIEQNRERVSFITARHDDKSQLEHDQLSVYRFDDVFEGGSKPEPPTLPAEEVATHLRNTIGVDIQAVSSLREHLAKKLTERLPVDQRHHDSEISNWATLEATTWIVCKELGLPYTPDLDLVREIEKSGQHPEVEIALADELADSFTAPLRERIQERDDQRFGGVVEADFVQQQENRWRIANLMKCALNPKLKFLAKAALISTLTTMSLLGIVQKAYGGKEDDLKDAVLETLEVSVADRSQYECSKYKDDARSKKKCGFRRNQRLAVELDSIQVLRKLFSKEERADTTAAERPYGHDPKSPQALYPHCQSLDIQGGTIVVECDVQNNKATRMVAVLDTPATRFGLGYYNGRASFSDFRKHRDNDRWKPVPGQQGYLWVNDSPDAMNAMLQRQREFSVAANIVNANRVEKGWATPASGQIEQVCKGMVANAYLPSDEQIKRLALEAEVNYEMSPEGVSGTLVALCDPSGSGEIVDARFMPDPNSDLDLADEIVVEIAGNRAVWKVTNDRGVLIVAPEHPDDLRILQNAIEEDSSLEFAIWTANSGVDLDRPPLENLRIQFRDWHTREKELPFRQKASLNLDNYGR